MKSKYELNGVKFKRKQAYEKAKNKSMQGAGYPFNKGKRLPTGKLSPQITKPFGKPKPAIELNPEYIERARAYRKKHGIGEFKKGEGK